MGHHLSPICCCRTAPTAISEASVIMLVGALGTGCRRRVAATSCFFKSCQSVFCPLHFFLAVFAGREERVEWLQGLGAMWKKAMVKVNHTEEFTELSLSCRFRKLLNNPYFLLQWANACAIDPVSQELEPSSTPDTLLGIDKYAVLV